jgi:hypothetical protein
VELLVESTDRWFLGTLAGGQEADLQTRVQNVSGGAQQIRVPLLRAEVRDRSDGDVRWTEGEPLSHLRSSGPGSSEPIQRHPVEDHAVTLAEPSRDRIADRLRDVDRDVVQLVGEPIQDPRRGHVSGPREVFGVHEARTDLPWEGPHDDSGDPGDVG